MVTSIRRTRSTDRKIPDKRVIGGIQANFTKFNVASEDSSEIAELDLNRVGDRNKRDFIWIDFSFFLWPNRPILGLYTSDVKIQLLKFQGLYSVRIKDRLSSWSWQGLKIIRGDGK